jgi:hypothetical protein
VKNCVPFFFQQLIYSDLWQEVMRAGEPMRNVSGTGRGGFGSRQRQGSCKRAALRTPCSMPDVVCWMLHSSA